MYLILLFKRISESFMTLSSCKTSLYNNSKGRRLFSNLSFFGGNEKFRPLIKKDISAFDQSNEE